MVAGARLTTLPIISTQGSLMAIAMGNDGFFHYSVPFAHATDEWTAWRTLPPLPAALPEPAIVADSNGAPAVFAVDSRGTIWVSSFMSHNRASSRLAVLSVATSSPSSSSNHEETGTWSPWHSVASPRSDGGLAVVLNPEGLIELFLRDRLSGNMLHVAQSVPGRPSGDWSKPTDLGIKYVGRPAVAMNEKATITVAAAGQTPGTLWLWEKGEAIRIANNVASAPALLLMGDTLYLAARVATATQSYLIKARKTGEWAPTQVVSPPPLVGGDSFGLLQRSATARIEPLKKWAAGAKPQSTATLAIKASVGESRAAAP
jgi:hypothetical protein